MSGKLNMLSLMARNLRRGAVLRLLSLPLICMISACNTSRGTYVSGPWGQTGYLDPRASLYPDPWNKPLDPAPIDPVSSPAPSLVSRSASLEQLDPVGAWASRDVAPPISNSGPFADHPDVHASAPPMIADYATNDPPLATSAPISTLEASSAPQPQSFTALTGQWNARDGDRSCRIQLSSTPTLDLYKASASGCSSDALQNVNSWSHRDRTIVLYARGQVVSRLFDDGGSYSGTLEGTKTRIKISR